jgi:hypothetical protein
MLPIITKDLTKGQIKTMAQESFQALTESGRILEAADMLAKMELFIKELKSNPEYIDYLRYEVAKYGSSTTLNGTRIELAEVGTKYDYTFCEDEIHNELIIRKASLDEQIKEREAFLKTLPAAGIEVINEDGVVCRIYPPSKHSTSSVKCTIQK